MDFNDSGIKLSLERLKIQYENIELLIQHNKSEKQSFGEGFNKELYREVSFFIYTIFSINELKEIFFDVMLYTERNKKNPVRLQPNVELNKIGKILSSINKKNKTLQYSFGKKYWIIEESRSVDFPQYINYLVLLKNKIWNYHELKSFLIIMVGENINGGIKRDLHTANLLNEQEDSIIEESLGKLDDILFDLDKIDNYLKGYCKYENFSDLYIIFSAFYPEKNKSEIFKNPNKSEIESIRQGNASWGHSYILNSCKIVMNYILLNINSSVLKKSYVYRFRTYIEIYKKEELLLLLKSGNIEKKLQSIFEEYIFFNGFYPISEAVLGDGRFDSLIQEKDKAVLFEFKQYGFKSNNGKRNLKKKINSAMIQSTIYLRRLSGIPGLAKEVYIIIFTRTPINIENNIITANGINFIIVIIHLTDSSPSKLKEPAIISAKDIIE